MTFIPVKQNRIAVEIVNQLKAAILSGRFNPGERLPTERELTRQFQVSRVVVREALRELEIKGLVRILQGPAGGAYVTGLSFDHLNNAFLDLFLYNKLSVAELIRTRMLIECEIARLAAAHADARGAERLKTALAAERSAGASHADFISNRLMVHHLLAEMSANRLLQAVATSLFRLTADVILEVKPVQAIIHRTEEHAGIVAAVLAGQPDAAAAAMKDHLDRMGRRMIKLEGTYRKRKGLDPTRPGG
ncbi:MAG: GntR family transcriptional regulator [Desulfobacterales bacterium]|jgi:DNA-binding FadR family transcriptional regulator|nr:GntR family transcriptional regulator [Desulfobacterales bacterium]